MPQALDVEQGYRYCQWLTAYHYENFPVASALIPAPMRRHVAAVYAFARTADDFADEDQNPGRALARLAQWSDALEASVSGGTTHLAAHPVFVALAETIRTQQLPVQWLRDLLTAFRRDVTVKRYPTWHALMTEYCRYSANPVGRLVLWLFGYRDEARQQLSDHICTALQLTNFWQDLGLDLKKDRIYLPQEALRRHGVSEDELFRHAATPRFAGLMMEAVTVAEDLFRRGAPLPGRVRGRLAWELRATWLGGLTILRRVRAAGGDTFRRRPALTGRDKCWIAVRALIRDGDAAHR